MSVMNKSGGTGSDSQGQWIKHSIIDTQQAH